MKNYRKELMKALYLEPTNKEYIDYLESKVDNLTKLINMIEGKK